MDKYEQLEKLAELKQKGILTDDEYEQQKAKLLSQRYITSATGVASQSLAPMESLPPYWQTEFGRVDELGLQAYKKFNWPAFFFTWIWAFTKGLWQNALVTLGVITFVVILDIAIDNDAVSRGLDIGLTIGLSVMYGQNGNKWYYRKHVKSEAVIY